MNNRVRILIRFGLLGIFLNVICGWFLVGVVSFPISDAHVISGEQPHEGWLVMVVNQRGGTMVASTVKMATRDLQAITFDDERMPTWSRQRSVAPYRAQEPMPNLRNMAYGWPFLSLSMTYDTYFEPRTGHFQSEQVGSVIPGLEFPIGIIAGGFIENTGFFALTSWILVTLLYRVQHVLRLHAGRCPTCTEILTGQAADGCAECGWNVATTDPIAKTAVDS